MAKDHDRRPGFKLIFVAYITLKDGRRIYARNYGKRAFPIWVRE